MYKLLVLTILAVASLPAASLPCPAPGSAARYRLSEASSKASVVTAFRYACQDGWVSLRGEKQDGSHFQVWVLDPAAPRRYVLQEGDGVPREYRHAVDGSAVLPSAVPLKQLLPEMGDAVTYLGHRYLRESEGASAWRTPENARIVLLRPDLLIGPASNARVKVDRRRWDGSDYEMVPFTRADYQQLADAGITFVRADDAQTPWADELGFFYWGGGKQLPFPEMLYRSQYIGPIPYLDEPAVGTRDHVLRPRLAKDEAFRHDITPAVALAAFEEHYREALEKGTPTRLQAVVASRADVDLGTWRLQPHNLYSWETMVATAAHELTARPFLPAALVFEPPGRIGSRRTLPELNMAAGTQFATGDTRVLTDAIFSFLRGAARLSGKEWGISIYGAVERADAAWWMTRAYDMGATRFFFWDNYQLATVPFSEYLALTRHLRQHAENHPARDLGRLRRAAEVAITLPPGYDLGHTHMGRGNLWGLPELNLERRNRAGVAYRTVMSNFWLEAERCINQGIPFDAMWELPGHAASGYREVVRIREDGKVEVEAGGKRALLSAARGIAAKPGPAPGLDLKFRIEGPGVTATALVRETGAPVYYTHGTDAEGVYRNAMVLWELYGPKDEDYRFLSPDALRPLVRPVAGGAEVETSFRLERAGVYRLRAAVVDTAGRRRVVWRTFRVDAAGAVSLSPGQ